MTYAFSTLSYYLIMFTVTKQIFSLCNADDNYILIHVGICVAFF